MELLPATRRIITRRGFPCEPHFNKFSLLGEVPQDYEPYFDTDAIPYIDLDIFEESSEDEEDSDSDDSVHHFATFELC